MSWIDDLLGSPELVSVERAYVEDLENIAIAYSALVWAGVEDWEGSVRAADRLRDLTRRATDDPDFGREDIMPLLGRGAE